MPEVMFAGPDGRLEGRYHHSKESRAPLALITALQTSLTEGAAIVWMTSSSVRQPIAGLDASNLLRPGVAEKIEAFVAGKGGGFGRSAVGR